MSNALFILAGLAERRFHTITPSDYPPSSKLLLALVAAGLCALVVWIVRKAANPQSLSLTRCSGRPNSINPAHVVVILAIWLASTSALGWAFAGSLGQGSARQLILIDALGRLPWLAASLIVAVATFRYGLRQGLGLTMRH